MKFVNILVLSALFFLLGANQTSAQLFLPDPLIAKYENGNLYIRWEPGTVAEWEKSNAAGYAVEVLDVSANMVKDVPIVQIVKPLPFDQWSREIGNAPPFRQNFYQGCANFLYPGSIEDEDHMLDKTFAHESKSSLDSLRLGLMMYSATYDFKLAEHTGLAIKLPAKQGHDYEVTVSCPGYPDKNIVLKAAVQSKEVPQVLAEWGDKVVRLKWNTYPHRKDYFGYMVERSRDGIHFTLQDSIPNVNTQEKLAKNNESFYSRGDSLDVNYETYYFKVRGFDYFGKYSERFSLATGHGFDKMTLSPTIIFADQTEDNEAHLKWKVPEQEAHLVSHFSVLRADSIDGEYILDVDSVSSVFRELVFPIKYNVNHYRIVANPKDGEAQVSMPVLVMGQDTVPPIKPIILSATIDSLGNAKVVWRENPETDLWGYRIYKSNFESDEYSLLNSYPTLDTVFIDSLDLDLGSEKVFYTIHAADKRNNRSPFSDTIRLTLPDIIPPASPMVSNAKQEEEYVKVHFVRSMSTDVINHILFRRDVKNEEAWQKIFEFDSTYIGNVIIDSLVNPETHYAYTMIAQDDAGLESKPKHFKELYVKKVTPPFIPFKSLEYTFNEDSTAVNFKWLCNDMDRFHSVMIYRGADKNKMSKYQYVDAPEMSITDEFTSDRAVVYYRFKPIFKKQKRAYFSDYIAIVNPNYEGDGE